MYFDEVSILVYRLIAPADNLSDPTYNYSHTLSGTVQPFTGDEAIHAGQAMENIRDLIVFTDPDTDIRKSDELVYNSETRRVAYIERFKSGVINHAEVMTTDSQWINEIYTVIFNSQGGSAVASQVCNRGGKVIEPTDPTKAGFTFSGWYKEITCINLWNFATDIITANTTIYAKWIAV